jgi:hypothetical protein
VRRLGIDGRQLDRATVTLAADPDHRELAAVVGRLLAPAPPRSREVWYRRRWVWGAAGVAAASAILVPFALRGDDSAARIVVRPKGQFSW